MWGYLESAKKSAQRAASAVSEMAAEAAESVAAAGEGRGQETAQDRRRALGVVLQEWKTKFTETHGRPPTNADLAADDSVSGVYREYKELGQQLGTAPSPERPSVPRGPAPAGALEAGTAVAVESAGGSERGSVVAAFEGEEGRTFYEVRFSGGASREVPASAVRAWHAFDDLAEDGCGDGRADLAGEAQAAAQKAQAAAQKLTGWFQTGIATASATMTTALDKFEGFVAEEKGRERRILHIKKDPQHKVGLAFKGGIVTAVTPGGAAQDAGVAPGMRIVAVDGKRVSDHMELLRMFAESGDELALTVETDKATSDPATLLIRTADDIDRISGWVAAVTRDLDAAQASGDPDRLAKEKRAVRLQWDDTVETLHSFLEKLQPLRLSSGGAESDEQQAEISALATKQLDRVESLMVQGDQLVQSLDSRQAQPQPAEPAERAEPEPAPPMTETAGSPRRVVQMLRRADPQSQFQGQVADIPDAPQGPPPAPPADVTVHQSDVRVPTEAFDEVEEAEGSHGFSTPAAATMTPVEGSPGRGSARPGGHSSVVALSAEKLEEAAQEQKEGGVAYGEDVDAVGSPRQIVTQLRAAAEPGSPSARFKPADVAESAQGPPPEAPAAVTEGVRGGDDFDEVIEDDEGEEISTPLETGIAPPPAPPPDAFQLQTEGPAILEGEDVVDSPQGSPSPGEGYDHTSPRTRGVTSDLPMSPPRSAQLSPSRVHADPLAE
eukprot:Hpha_TRINITY_DN15694_c0_g3::TRINITY_DN15694_c0_g3_i1::g.98145::m.98145